MNYFDSCPSCERPVKLPTLEDRSFPYGRDEDLLVARIYVYECTFCDIEFTDHRADVSRHLAVCQHLGILAPNRILEMRACRHLTDKDIAASLGVEESTVTDWQFAISHQSPAQDKVLRQLFEDTPIKHE